MHFGIRRNIAIPADRRTEIRGATIITPMPSNCSPSWLRRSTRRLTPIAAFRLPASSRGPSSRSRPWRPRVREPRPPRSPPGSTFPRRTSLCSGRGGMPIAPKAPCCSSPTMRGRICANVSADMVRRILATGRGQMSTVSRPSKRSGRRSSRSSSRDRSITTTPRSYGGSYGSANRSSEPRVLPQPRATKTSMSTPTD